MTQKTCCFFGHRFITNEIQVRERLIKVLDKLIQKGYNQFIIGTHGDFDRLALSVCRELRRENDIKIVVVFTSVSKIIKNKNSNLSSIDLYQDCETIIYDIENIYYKNQIMISNQQMIKNSDFVIFYVDESKSISGAKTAMKFAIKNKKKIYNLFLEIDRG
ncbi:MAG: DUF1273 family protein [Clostridia bacterium]|nr:DUF1273 family protein [Clostridia bacterium]